MSLEQQLQSDLVAAMRGKQADVVACIRQLKSKVQEITNQKDFSGPIDDALYQKAIVSYCKSLEKAIIELAAMGAHSQALRDKYQHEIDYLARYLPALHDAAQTKVLVEACLKQYNITDIKQSGRALGMLLKAHPGVLDPALTKQLIEAALE